MKKHQEDEQENGDNDHLRVDTPPGLRSETFHRFLMFTFMLFNS